MSEVMISPVAKGVTLVCAALSPPESTLRGSLYSNAKGKGEDARCRMLGVSCRRQSSNRMSVL